MGSEGKVRGLRGRWEQKGTEGRGGEGTATAVPDWENEKVAIIASLPS